MRKQFLYILIAACTLIAGSTYAQDSTDSIAVVHKQWEATKIAKGLWWKQGHFTKLFGSEQHINFVEIDLKKYRKKLGLAASSKALIKTSDMARAQGALVAINGGFFDVDNGGAVDFIQVEHQVINHTRNPNTRANGLFMFSKKQVEIRTAQKDTIPYNAYPSILLSGPLLLKDNKSEQLLKNAFNDHRHPRSGIALTNDNKLIFLVVDGRNSKASGMTLRELTAIFRWLDAKDAMNLDGGGSSTLFIEGMTPNGVVNHPSDNGLFDHKGERPVANSLYIKGHSH